MYTKAAQNMIYRIIIFNGMKSSLIANSYQETLLVKMFVHASNSKKIVMVVLYYYFEKFYEQVRYSKYIFVCLGGIYLFKLNNGNSRTKICPK